MPWCLHGRTPCRYPRLQMPKSLLWMCTSLVYIFLCTWNHLWMTCNTQYNVNTISKQLVLLREWWSHPNHQKKKLMFDIGAIFFPGDLGSGVDWICGYGAHRYCERTSFLMTTPSLDSAIQHVTALPWMSQMQASELLLPPPPAVSISHSILFLIDHPFPQNLGGICLFLCLVGC